MKTHRSRFLPRMLLRGTVLGGFAALVLGSSPAFADVPSGWDSSPRVSVLQALLIYFLIPLGLFVVISVLAALPSLIKGDSYTPGQAWVGEGEWFGGPRKAMDPAEHTGQARAIESAGERGGAGARF